MEGLFGRETFGFGLQVCVLEGSWKNDYRFVYCNVCLKGFGKTTTGLCAAMCA